MEIRPKDVGFFQSVEQKRAYDDTMRLKTTLNGYAQEMMKVDDVIDVDFNKNKGKVLVDKLVVHNNTDNLDEKIVGTLDFNTKTKNINKMDVEILKQYGGIDHFRMENKRELFGLGSEKEVMTVFHSSCYRTVYTTDKKTGVINVEDIYV